MSMTLRKAIETERRRIMGARYTPWDRGFSCCLCDARLIDVDEFNACPKCWDRVVALVRASGVRVLEYA